MPFPNFNDISAIAPPWLVSEWKYLIAMLVVGAGALWIWRRTGSSHVFNAILWRRLVKQRTEGPPWLSEFLDERDHLMRFRAQTGLTKAPSLLAGRRVVEWSRAHDLDIDRVAVIQLLIDFDKPGLNDGSKPKESTILVVENFSVLLLLGAIVLGTIGAFTPAAIQVVQSKDWYAVQADRAKRLFNPDSRRAVSFQTAQCADQAAIAAKTTYPSHDVAVLCELMGSADGAKMVKDVRTVQWILAAAGVLMMLWFGGKARLVFRRDKVAFEVHERLEKLSAPSATPESHAEAERSGPDSDSPADRALAGSARPDALPPTRAPSLGRQPDDGKAAAPSMSEITFVWDHWKFNADQRIKAFNFFVVFSVFANGGLFTAIEKCAHPIALGTIGTFIALLAIIFWMIDSRSRILIQLSVAGIKRYELGLSSEARLFHRDQANAHRFARYSNSFQILFLAQLALGMLVIAYAIASGFDLAQSWLPALATCKP